MGNHDNQCGDDATWSVKDGVLTISADKFSTYALVYADVPETPDPIVPATGDQSHLVFFTTMLLLSAAGIYLASRKLRRA